MAGLPAVKVVLEEMDPRLQFEPAQIEGKVACDGMAVQRGLKLATLHGPARSLLTAERWVLNFLGRLSGIATLTRRFVDAAAGTKARVYDTRKTTPGWRLLEKYAVRQGGGHNHRTGLYDAILIKDNHLAIGGIQTHSLQSSAAAAVRQARKFIDENFSGRRPSRQMMVEIEIDSLDQLELTLNERPDIVLLDNMGLDDLRRAVELRNSLAKEVQLEASGGH